MATILGIDVGGSGIKAALVDTDTGELLSDRHRLETPEPSTPKNMAATVRQLVAQFDYAGTVGCCFPTVVIDGKAKTAGNIDETWRNTQVDAKFEDATGLPFVVLNDADAAGVAEMQLGAGVGLEGMVIMITIGTASGAAFSTMAGSFRISNWAECRVRTARPSNSTRATGRERSTISHGKNGDHGSITFSSGSPGYFLPIISFSVAG